MEILIAGPGCARCRTTEKIVTDACNELKVAANISHIYDVKEYSKYGVKITPAVIIDNKIVISGRIPSPEEIKQVILQFKDQ